MAQFPGNSLYFHISNSGVTLSVEDTTSGPLLKLESNTFGHPTGSVGVYISPDHFADLEKFFGELKTRQFCQPPYGGNAADTPRFANGNYAILEKRTAAYSAAAVTKTA